MHDLEERFLLCRERIREILEIQEVNPNYSDYFKKMADYLADMLFIYDRVKDGTKGLEGTSEQELKKMNEMMYQDILPCNYDKSYANPDYAAERLGIFGVYLSYLTAELHGMPAYVFENRLFDMVILLELFVEIYCIFKENEEPKIKSIRDALYYHAFDYVEELVTMRIRETLDPEQKFAYDIVIKSDLQDLSYLYTYGEYISGNEVKLAAYMNTFSEEEIEAMAATYTEGFRRGFITMRIDMSKKKTVNIRYAIGQERMVRAAIRQFEAMGLSPILNRYAVNRINRRLTAKQGFTGTAVNKQFEYDHRMDDAVFLDADFLDRKISATRKAYASMKELASVYAGPAVIEVFGETPFHPSIKENALKYSDKQQKLSVQLAAKSSEIVNKFIPGDEYSFTIIAYPIPEIGNDFEAIFRDTVTVNTLDNEKYTRIQQSIVDILDQAQFVTVQGQNGNKTDMKIMLHELKNPTTETKFENCVADVNIPVGEVFTSPVLTGTEGVLHVSSVYLNGLHYKNLTIHFQNGMISDYSCSNYEREEDNRNYIRENLLQNRETLPIGEFAIGTNTTAYVMAKKYDILSKLPILIVEKMGPHFAVGDTCYSYAEDKKVYNPDGKEIIAKDNECSVLRNEEPSKAYFNCHTDITIPYDEIAGIYAVDVDGNQTAIMKGGRFVLPGTEELNEVLNGVF